MEIRKMRETQGKLKRAEMVREISGNLRKEGKGKVREF